MIEECAKVEKKIKVIVINIGDQPCNPFNCGN